MLICAKRIAWLTLLLAAPIAGAYAADRSVETEILQLKNGRLYFFSQDYAVIPGPRFIQLLEAMATVIHPEVDW